MAWLRLSMLDARRTFPAEKRLQGLAPGALRMRERWPALQEGGEDGCLFVRKPLHYLRNYAFLASVMRLANRVRSCT